MSEEKREKMRNLKVELDNLIAQGVVPPGSVLSPDAMKECLKLNWARRDGSANFVPTELGRAMAGRKDN